MQGQNFFYSNYRTSSTHPELVRVYLVSDAAPLLQETILKPPVKGKLQVIDPVMGREHINRNRSLVQHWDNGSLVKKFLTMGKDMATKNNPRFSLYGLSLQQRLPLLICALLLCIIVSFGLASYFSVKRSAMEMGRERLTSVTNNLSSILAQSTGAMLSSLKKTADNDTVRQSLATGNAALLNNATQFLKKLRTDSTVVMLQLLDTHFVVRQAYSEADTLLQQTLSKNWNPAADPAGLGPNRVGKMFAVNNKIYFPVITTVTNNKKLLGYLVSWRLLATTPQAVEQISKLMGKGAVLYMANRDGSLWTDMMQPVATRPVDIKSTEPFFEYSNTTGEAVIAAREPINNSNWLVLIEFSRQNLTEGAARVLNRILLIGTVLMLAGIFIAWMMSRNITRPLKLLTNAATAISQGDYAVPVTIDRTDELGELARAFNSMQQQVQATQQNLEKKVAERTAQLEAVNKELEAFSYSVSHDLRAPLRGIIGFTTMLEEKYVHELDDEAKRLTSVIKKNTVQMGELIDDLLAFSRLARHNMVKRAVNTNQMVHEIIAETAEAEQRVSWHVDPLPQSFGDSAALKQVWVNLVSNAIKYSKNVPEPRIEIGSTREHHDIIFFIKDNGVGFDPRYMDKLFKVFQRLHSAAEFEGTGVGLAMVEKIVSKHGGRVWAEAEKNKGASFYFSLPVE